jgi:hypothetical protein
MLSSKMERKGSISTDRLFDVNFTPENLLMLTLAGTMQHLVLRLSP